MLQPRRNTARPMLLGVGITLVAACQPARSSPPADAPAAEPAEQVGIAYGKQPRDRVTGAISSTTFEETDPRRRAGSVEEMLQGRFPGVQILRTRGGISVRIRSAASLTAGGEPLYVVDGIPVRAGPGGVLMDVDPMDIARIDVLRDVSSTSIYGKQGAHGVVLITTRKEP